MLVRQSANPAIHAAVLEYFAGERAEMVAAIAVSLVVSVAAVWLLAHSRTGFAVAFAITTMLAAGSISGGLGSLMARDAGRSQELGVALGTGRSPVIMASERRRMVVVISKYRYYRYGAALLALLAMAGVLLSHRGWTHGVAAALLLVVVSQVMIDQFSEARARTYLTKLPGPWHGGMGGGGSG